MVENSRAENAKRADAVRPKTMMPPALRQAPGARRAGKALRIHIARMMNSMARIVEAMRIGWPPTATVLPPSRGYRKIRMPATADSTRDSPCQRITDIQRAGRCRRSRPKAIKVRRRKETMLGYEGMFVTFSRREDSKTKAGAEYSSINATNCHIA
jgi:hypothetical protein